MGRVSVGVSKVNITPYVGIWLCGFAARHKPSEDVHDDLYARAIVFSDGQEKIALVTCDLLALDVSSIESIRSKAETMTDIKGENILISTTHTHSGPLSSSLRGFGPLDTEWVSVLEKKIAGAIAMAWRHMQESSVGAGRGQAFINMNRRGGKAIDRELGVLKVNNPEGKTIAVVMNYPCHPVIVPLETHTISADYPGYATKVIEQNLNGSVGLFFTGTCGNINPIAVSRTFEEVERLGTIVGAEALKVCNEITEFQAVDKVRSAREIIRLKSQEIPSAEELEKIVSIGSSAQNPELDWQYNWAKDALEFARSGKLWTEFTMEIQALSIGDDIAFVGIPGEVFVEIGLAIKERSPFKYTFPIECANGCLGYIPTREAFDEGGYEPALAFKLFGIYPMDRDVEPKVIDSALRILSKLKTG